MRQLHFIIAGMIFAGLLGSRQAACSEIPVVQYELRANGMATGSAPGGGIALADLGLGPDGGTFELEIWAKVSNNTYNIGGTDYDLGLLHYTIDIYDSSGNARDYSDALIPTEAVVWGFGNGFWDSGSTSPFVNYPGALFPQKPLAQEDVISQSGLLPLGDFAANLTTIGANVWSKVGWGEYTWDGTDAVTLTAKGRPGGTGIAYFPPNLTGYPAEFFKVLSDIGGSVDGDTLTFYQLPDPSNTIPEPSTLILLATGAIGLLAGGWRRRLV